MRGNQGEFFLFGEVDYDVFGNTTVSYGQEAKDHR